MIRFISYQLSHNFGQKVQPVKISPLHYYLHAYGQAKMLTCVHRFIKYSSRNVTSLRFTILYHTLLVCNRIEWVTLVLRKGKIKPSLFFKNRRRFIFVFFGFQKINEKHEKHENSKKTDDFDRKATKPTEISLFGRNRRFLTILGNF